MTKDTLMFRRFCHVVALVVACCGTRAFAQAITVSPLRAVPRWGNSSCWADTGGRLKNTCSTAQLLTFPVDQALAKKLVAAAIYTDAPFAKLTCQHASLDPLALSAYWAVSYMQGNASVNWAGVSFVSLDWWQVPYPLYQIDCSVPPGAQVLGALISWK